MKALLIASAAAFAVAGCATEGTQQVAKVDCKVAPMTTSSMSYGSQKAKPVDSLDQGYAMMKLGTSDYRLRNLQRNGPDPNNIEDAMRDCDKAAAR